MQFKSSQVKQGDLSRLRRSLGRLATSLTLASLALLAKHRANYYQSKRSTWHKSTKNEVLSTFQEIINNSLAEMYGRKLGKHLFKFFLPAQCMSSTFELKKGTSLPQQPVTLMPSTPLRANSHP